MHDSEKVNMKNELRAWIDKEVARLDQVLEGQNPDTVASDPVPEDLREALAETSGKKPQG
jgi:hypothetical protein